MPSWRNSKPGAGKGLTDGAYIRAAPLAMPGRPAQRPPPYGRCRGADAGARRLQPRGNNQNQTTRALNELLLIAHEQSNARLENLVQELADAIRGMPTLFAEPVAEILAALSGDSEG